MSTSLITQFINFLTQVFNLFIKMLMAANTSEVLMFHKFIILIKQVLLSTIYNLFTIWNIISCSSAALFKQCLIFILYNLFTIWNIISCSSAALFKQCLIFILYNSFTIWNIISCSLAALFKQCLIFILYNTFTIWNVIVSLSNILFKQCLFFIIYNFFMALNVITNFLGVLLAILVTTKILNFILVTTLILYCIFNIFMYFFWGSIGLRGIFFINECIIITLLVQLIIYLGHALITNMYLSWVISEFMIHDDLILMFTIHLDLLAVLGVITVLILTAIVLTFGIEYLSREAFAYNVLVILGAFSSSIVWFIITYDLGVMTIFWELAGFFSLLLVDTFYSRIRTTQAVSRTFAISRFSDYVIFLGVVELMTIFDSDSLAIVFACIREIALESSTLIAYLFETPAMLITLCCFFIAASCKCAQLILFVWLPDAMEAPTPASALIHSSTLVVMGIFMLLRLMPLFSNSQTMLTIFTLVGAITIAYGAICSVQTSDLKKAVAYSTISQVGYLFCGCGLTAVTETLIYLVVHAICKAMLFIFVGYIVHLFGGTTSMRKMGGIFYILPDIALYTFILCIILAGAPYTVGFFAKELIVAKILSAKNIITLIVLICWTIAFICTPIY